MLDPSQRADVRRITRAFFARPCDSVAQELLGTLLLVNGVGGPIIETEGYDGDDPASHSYPMRRTERNAVMFGPPGHAYVYRSYGIHWCLNFVCETGSAVLVRALVPEHGIDVMQRRRGMERCKTALCGPWTALPSFRRHRGPKRRVSVRGPIFAAVAAANGRNSGRAPHWYQQGERSAAPLWGSRLPVSFQTFLTLCPISNRLKMTQRTQAKSVFRTGFRELAYAAP